MSELCPRCKSNLLKRITLSGVLWKCLNASCDYSRELKAGEKKWVIQTKVKAFLDDKFLSDDYILIVDNSGIRENKAILTMQDNPGAGKWKYYLEDLMCLGKYGKDRIIQDQLYLDWGQSWYLTGMSEVYKEIINTLVLRGISI